MPVTLNGRPPRKQLTDQLDRLDSILDGLADALNDAVADAARQGGRAAVREILASPDFRSLLQRPAPPEAEPTPGVWTRLQTVIRTIRDRIVAAARRVVDSVRRRVRDAVPAVSAGVSIAALAWRLRDVAVLAVGAGVAAAAVSYFAPRPVGAVLGGIGGAASALAVRGLVWARTAARHLTAL